MLWAIFLGIVVLLLALDLGVLNRENHKIELKESLLWSAFWISLGLGFSVFVYFAYDKQWFGIESHLTGREASVEYLSGYLLEKSLSMDNIFVIVMIFARFRVPAEYQHRVLFWGILGAIVFRGAMIGVGIQALRAVDWMFYVFGGLLIILALKTLFEKDEEPDFEKGFVVKALRRVLPFTGEINGPKFTVIKDGSRYFTRLFMALIVIEMTDVVFAVDSIPAVFAVTQESFIVFSSNIFAILGLRSLYFALADLVHRFAYLSYSLVAILLFVGVKMCLMDVYHLPTEISLGVITGLLVIGIVGSLWATRRQRKAEESQAMLASQESVASEDGEV